MLAKIYRVDPQNGEKASLHLIKEYDSAGNLIKEQTFDPNGQLKGLVHYEYNSAGNLTKHQIFAPDGRLKCCWNYEYDSAGNLIKKTYEESGQIKDYDIYEYDSDGRMIKRISVKGGETKTYDYPNGAKVEDYGNRIIPYDDSGA